MSDEVLAPEVLEPLQRAMAGDSTGLNSLFRDYLTDARRTLEQLRNATEANELRVKAHYMKSSSAVLGTRRVARCAGAIEQSALTGDLSEVSASIEHLSAALNEVEQELVRRFGPAVLPPAESAA